MLRRRIILSRGGWVPLFSLAVVVALHGGKGCAQRGVVVGRREEIGPALLLVVLRHVRVLLVVGRLGKDRWLEGAGAGAEGVLVEGPGGQGGEDARPRVRVEGGRQEGDEGGVEGVWGEGQEGDEGGVDGSSGGAGGDGGGSSRRRRAAR